MPRPNPLETIRRAAAVCTSGRRLYTLDGELLGACYEVDGERFVDTNCYLVFREAFELIAWWYLMPRHRHAVGDRRLWRPVKRRNLPRAHSGERTVCYRTAYEVHYRHFGRTPPPGAKPRIAIRKSAPSEVPPERLR
jgi:hypothetical protein